MIDGNDLDQDAPILAIAAAAELAGMHPQTLRQYDRLGLVVPARTQGGAHDRHPGAHGGARPALPRGRL